MNPPQPEHHQVDRQIDRHHANVPGHPIEQRAQGQDMEQQQKHRLGPVQSLLPQLSQLKSQQEQKGDFDHLRRLQIESAPRAGRSSSCSRFRRHCPGGPAGAEAPH